MRERGPGGLRRLGGGDRRRGVGTTGIRDLGPDFTRRRVQDRELTALLGGRPLSVDVEVALTRGHVIPPGFLLERDRGAAGRHHQHAPALAHHFIVEIDSDHRVGAAPGGFALQFLERDLPGLD